jgi:hypothetical protein
MLFKSKIKSGINYLELTPVRKYKYKVEENGKVTVLIPRFTNKFLTKHLMSRMKSPDIKVNLDEFGSSAWLKADGSKRVNQISDELLSQFGEVINPVNERLTKFFTQLYQYKFITFNEIER